LTVGLHKKLGLRGRDGKHRAMKKIPVIASMLPSSLLKTGKGREIFLKSITAAANLFITATFKKPSPLFIDFFAVRRRGAGRSGKTRLLFVGNAGVHQGQRRVVVLVLIEA
jgi:hypothetical protein